MTNTPSRLEKITGKLAGTVIGAELALCQNNFDMLHMSAYANEAERFRWFPIDESYFGDVPEMATAILAAGWAANKLEEYGAQIGSKRLVQFGRALPALTGAAVGTYYTLGESILPQILPGTADARDIPAVIVTTLAAPTLTNYLRKKWATDWKEQAFALIRQHQNQEEPSPDL